ncbi:PorT family protein [Carboxylicivirga sp. A043]|uniref:type IX secretion/gliding motility protein PorT/SprT n=1 Tax=Carboxylicivirga litoralis TaxID=2816963 RepID=UPI0021CB728B|nr:porin family protein [Carboxylicivirga sp. A043]MCU4154455.1 PorT family protein [Carboxylicivirga sp. A043]
MKKLLIVIFLLVQVSAVFAQGKRSRIPNLRSFDERPLHFGFLIGINTMDFKVYNTGMPISVDGELLYADVVDLTPGLNIGIVSSYKLREHLNLRFLPGISFGQRNMSYIRYDGDGNMVGERETFKIKSTYLEFPLLLKYNAFRMHNAKPYLVGGFNTRFDLAKDKQDKLLLNSLDGYLEFGAGFDFYLTYFRLSVEAKMSIGLADMLNHDGTGEPGDEAYTEALNKLNSRIFCLTFYFE